MVYDLVIITSSVRHASALQKDYNEANLEIKIKCASKYEIINNPDGKANLKTKFVVLADNTTLNDKERGFIRDFARQSEVRYRYK